MKSSLYRNRGKKYSFAMHFLDSFTYGVLEY